MFSNLFWFVSILGCVPLALAQSKFINCGGEAYTDPNGIVWEADNYFNTGRAGRSSNPITGTNIPELYRSERYDILASPELKYNVPIPNGQYSLKLHFSETYSGTMAVGARVFDVKVEGSTKFIKVDIFAQSGNAGNKALVKSTTVTVNDGFLTIEFIRIVENPTISGIEIRPAEPPSSGVRINVGGPSYVDNQGKTWVPDAGFINEGNAYTNSAVITGTSDPTLYRSERYDPPGNPPMIFKIPIPNGNYQVQVRTGNTCCVFVCGYYRTHEENIPAVIFRNIWSKYVSWGACIYCIGGRNCRFQQS